VVRSTDRDSGVIAPEKLKGCALRWSGHAT